MKALTLLFLMLVSGFLFAQEQMALRLNEKGIMKILQLGLQYNTATKESRTVIIPANTYKFTLPKEKLLSNPIVPIVNEVSDLNLNRDLDFFLNTSDISINGDVDVKSLKAEIFNSNENGFDVRLSLNLPEIIVNGERLSLCEDKDKYSNNCGHGLKASLGNLRIATVSRPVALSMVLRLRTDGKVARVIVRSVNSNLEGKASPELDINFSSLQVPRIAIVINGQESELDTSRLREKILNYKTFLGKKLIAFAADFIANDVAEMLNVYLINKEIATSYQLYSKDRPLPTFNEFLTEQQDMQLYNSHRDNTYVYQKPQQDIKTSLMAKVAELVRSAQLDLSLKKISTPGNKDIELSGLLNFVLNGRQIRVQNRLGNSNRVLPELNLDSHRNYDINLAISEPVINGALDLANANQLFQKLFKSMSPVKGVGIRSVKMHFAKNSSLIAVVNAQVDLKQLESTGVGSWFKNKIAVWLERNNNDSVIYFPIEVAVVPVFKKLPGGGIGLDLKVLSPFNYTSLPNRFNYPSNVPKMSETVKDGVMEELKTSIGPFTNKTYSVDLSNFLNKSGVVFLPRNISIDQGAYLLMDLDIVDIKFNAKNPNQR
jgi:hypothetical protein